ncbi:hypothetical protein DVH24_007781 [Malus domestica]|uniref:Uncharacterized protein n=1 Tax=Malus domestica TaxID=3750 RepID=A0A498JQL1_MALDO|nr:hypothetical protein DVH24_007781 [Malus domestica]
MRSEHEAELTGAEAEGITANAVESFGNKPQEDQEEIGRGREREREFIVMVEDAQDSESPLKEAHVCGYMLLSISAMIMMESRGSRPVDLRFVLLYPFLSLSVNFLKLTILAVFGSGESSGLALIA